MNPSRSSTGSRAAHRDAPTRHTLGHGLTAALLSTLALAVWTSPAVATDPATSVHSKAGRTADHAPVSSSKRPASRTRYANGAACELPVAHAAKPAARTSKPRRHQVGLASYYGSDFAGRRTANGERFDPRAMTAAHRTLPLGTRVRVTNLENGRQVVVRINDRGPYRKGRVLDLSHAAARKLGFVDDGVAHVRIEVLKRTRREHRADDLRADAGEDRTAPATGS
jgi:rare lipoprotein A